MKRLFGLLVVAGILVATFVATQGASALSTNNFRISSFDIQYELSRDSEGRSVLKTTELITAEFSNFNYNHGLERAIPTSYDGHSVSTSIDEATNLDGNDKRSTTTSDGLTILRIGDPDTYVHGEQKYRIVYTQRDVTRYFKDTSSDEWYWDTNGTEWRVPIDTLSVSIKIAPELIDAQKGTPVCYFGAYGSTDRCTVEQVSDGAYAMTATDVSPGQNASVAFGFEEGTFKPYKMSTWEIVAMIWIIVQILAVPVAIAGFVGMTILYVRKSNRSRETNPLVAEYIPPRDASVMVAAQLITAGGSAFTAQLIDLAVRHYISIVETRPKSTWKAAEYDVVIITDLTPLLAEEKEIISDMFGHLPQVNERLALKTLISNTPYSTRTMDNSKKLKNLIETTYQLRAKDPAVSRTFRQWAIVFGVLAVVMLSPLVGFAAGLALIMAYTIRPLTDKGLALRRYILGLDRYVKASEVDRLKFLQGPDTAQKVGYDVDPSNPGQIVKLYERVLPYAILFGREKDWSKRLGDFYQQSGTSPDWYAGTTAFNAAVFASTMGNISQASSYSSGISSSSSSGGSSGGGFSGGGGGGGGGGGW